MCCIFTCCGWMIDLVQRLWTFTMSCCISSAVCCLMMTGSMSGIALGYNYSLAEYIDLKETNVSVYLKRGVFDDEIADDMDWRRSGRLPVAGHIGTDNLMTGAPAEDDSTPLRSGRRLDDSLIESDDPTKYEGSLMRLTAQPPYPGTTTGSTEPLAYAEPASNFSPGSLNHLKEVQGLIDARKSAKAKSLPRTTYADIDERYLAHLPANPNLPPAGRRMMPGDLQAPNMVERLNPARLAVPGADIGSKENWLYPKDRGKYLRQFSHSDIDYGDFRPEYPSPIRLNTGPVRPTKTSYPEMRTNSPDEKQVTQARMPHIPVKQGVDALLKSFKEKMLVDKYEAPLPGPKKTKESSEEYDEDIRGLPVRRRRSIGDAKENSYKNTVSTLGPLKTIVLKKHVLNEDIVYLNRHYKNARENKLYEIKEPKQDVDSGMISVNDKISTFVHQDGKKLTETLLWNKLLGNKPQDINNLQANLDKNKIDYIGKIWYWFLGEMASNKARKLNNDFNIEPIDSDTKAIETLSTIGVSVNGVNPSIMMKVLQSTIA